MKFVFVITHPSQKSSLTHRGRLALRDPTRLFRSAEAIFAFARARAHSETRWRFFPPTLRHREYQHFIALELSEAVRRSGFSGKQKEKQKTGHRHRTLSCDCPCHFPIVRTMRAAVSAIPRSHYYGNAPGAHLASSCYLWGTENLPRICYSCIILATRRYHKVSRG